MLGIGSERVAAISPTEAFCFQTKKLAESENRAVAKVAESFLESLAAGEISIQTGNSATPRVAPWGRFSKSTIFLPREVSLGNSEVLSCIIDSLINANELSLHALKKALRDKEKVLATF